MDFGKAFLKAAAHKRLIRKDMALKLGLSENYFYDLCLNKKQPSVKLILNAADVCDVKLSDFIRWGEE